MLAQRQTGDLWATAPGSATILRAVRVFRSVWFRAAVSAALLSWLGARIDMDATVRSMAAITPSHLVTGLLLVALDRALMITRWVMLIRRFERTISIRSAVWVFLVGASVGHALPSGFGADAVRAYALAQRTARGADAVGLVVVDRYLGVCSLALLAAMGLVLWSNQAVPELQQVSAVLAAAVVAGAAGLLWADRLLALAARPRHEGNSLLVRAYGFARTLGQYRRHGRLVAALLALSFVVQVTRVLQAYVFGLGLGIDVAFSYYFAFMPVCILAALLPISIAGVGVAQGAMVALLRPVGVPDEQSFALSTILVLAALLSATPGALLLIRSRLAGARA